MLVEPPGQGDQHVLEVTVVWGRDDHAAAWPQGIEAPTQERSRRVQMLDDLGAHDQIEGILFFQPVSHLLVRGHDLKSRLRIFLSGKRDAAL